MTEEDVSKLSYEQALHELEKVVATLESGEAPLDKSIELYTLGSILKDHCQKKLNSAEEKISVLYSELKQRNPSIVPLKTLENAECGLAIIWDNETLDLSNTGIYQTIVNPNNHIFHINNNNTEFVVSNKGHTGIGTNNPTEKLHTFTSHNNNNNVCIEVSKNNYDTTNFENIKFVGKDNVILGQFSVNNSRNYQKLTPRYDNLIAYYKFDEQNGTNKVSESTKNNFEGTLENFDIYNCYTTGLINNGLQFDGSDDYIDLGEVNTLNSLAKGASTGQDFSISCWVKIANNIATSSNLDIISNNGVLGTTGTYLFGLSDYGSNGGAYISSSLTSSTGYFRTSGSTDLSDNSWNFINCVYHNSNTTLQNYVNGIIESSVTLTGNINSNPSNNIYIGSRNSTDGVFKGVLDELRIYDTSLTQTNINELYEYGNEKKGEITFSTQNGLNNSVLSKDSHGFTLDDTGKVSGLQLKNRPFNKISGDLTMNNLNGNVSGNSDTKFDSELQVGDILNFSTYEKVITNINSDNNLTLDGLSENTTFSNVIRKPAISSFFDQDNNLKSIIDYHGNMSIGGNNAETKLEISGSGDSNDLPYLTLKNTTDEDTDNGRETKIVFKGNNGGTYSDLSYIEVNHDGSGNDNKGKIKFHVNDGSNTTEMLRLSSSSNIGIGVTSEPIGKLQIKNINNETNNLVMSSSSPFNKTFGESNNIYFQGVVSSLPNNDLDRYSLSAIKGSCNDNTDNPIGRLDLLTNNNNSLGLQKRVSILNNGNVGFGITQPTKRFHVAPKLNIDTNLVGSQTNTSVTLSSGVVTDSNVIGGYVIFDDNNHTKKKITARPNASTLTVDESGTVSSNNLSVYYPGLSMDLTGNVAIGTETSLSKFHVEGPLSTAIKTITADYSTTNSDSTIIANPTGSSTITVTLTNIASIVGRRYIIKNISSSGTVNITPGSGTIDGASSKSLNTQNKFYELQTDGTNWYIIGGAI